MGEWLDPRFCRPAPARSLGLDTHPGISCASLRRGIRRKPFFREESEFRQQVVGPLRLGGVDSADGKADVDQHILADLRFGDEIQEDLARHATETYLSEAAAGELGCTDNFSRNGKAHDAISPPLNAIGAF